MLKLIYIGAFKLFPIVFLFVLSSCNPKPKEDLVVKRNQQGVDLMNEGKYELAIKEFKEAAKAATQDRVSQGTIYRNIALAFEELQSLDSASHYYSIAAKCYRKNSYDYLINMASVDLITGKTNDALSKLLKAEILDSEDLSVNNALGVLYLGDDGEEFTDLEKALKYNKKAFEISESRITEEVLARNYYYLENYELAEMHYEKICNQYPDILDYNLTTGMIKYKLKKKKEAEPFFAKALALDSSYKETIDYFIENNK